LRVLASNRAPISQTKMHDSLFISLEITVIKRQSRKMLGLCESQNSSFPSSGSTHKFLMFRNLNTQESASDSSEISIGSSEQPKPFFDCVSAKS